MVLDLNYFSNQIHVDDLQKLNENELKFIIRLFQDELNDGFKLKGIIKACNKTSDLLKDFRFILYGYMDVIKEKDLTFCYKTNTLQLILDITKIDIYLTKIKTDRVSKKKLKYLVDTCLLNMRLLYDSMDEYIIKEYNLWEAERCRQKEESENS